MKIPGSETARERIGQGPIGRFSPGSEFAWERKGREPCLLSQLTHFKLYSFRFKFRREMFLDIVNSAAVNTVGRQQIPKNNYVVANKPLTDITITTNAVCL